MASVSPDAVALAVRIGTALGSAALPATLDDELRAATAAIRTTFGAAACSAAIVQPDGGSLRFVAADGAGAERIVGTVLDIERGIAGWVAMSGQAVVVADVRADPRFARDVAESTSYVPTSIMAAPMLRRDGEVVGVIEVLDRDGTVSTGRDLDLLGLLGAQLAVVVTMAARYDRLGAMVVAGLTGDPDDGEVAERMAAAVGEGDEQLAALTASVARLSAVDGRSGRLVRQVLDAVGQYATERR